VSQGNKTPVAIRITRPYATEDEFLARELDTLSRSGVTLVGAQSRPEGVVLRFEITLADGTPILRGEGRVVGYKASAHGSEPGLSLRFTRLDSKSKTLVDKAGALRDARAGRPSKAPPAPVSTPELAPSSPQIPVASESAPTPEPALVPVPDTSAAAPDRDQDREPEPRSEPTDSAEPDPTPPGAAPVAPANPRPPPPIVAALSGDRESVLERLRSRKAALSPERIEELLREGSARARK